ncbi:hypothetical protein [Agrobacterium rosae]|uniref:hypothetical protein n=1 Tax=Agrobacterium rosae TaxID=1972867 RepID=UPI003BA004A4
MTSVTVDLTREYSVSDVKFKSVTLREPTYADVFMSGLGEPRELQPVAGGGVAFLVYPERIDGYLLRLASNPGYEYLHGISAVDALRVQNAICGFFREKPDVSTSQTSSSSGSDGMQTASSE